MRFDEVFESLRLLREIAVGMTSGGTRIDIAPGVGASFLDQVTGTENIAVGTFACEIIEPSDGDIAVDGTSVTYTAPLIESSASGSAANAGTEKTPNSPAATRKQAQ